MKELNLIASLFYADIAKTDFSGRQKDRFGCNSTIKMLVCVYLLSAQNTGQKDTVVAESPTSNIEEHGLISGGREASAAASNPHGPHTITWANTHKHK